MDPVLNKLNPIIDVLEKSNWATRITGISTCSLLVLSSLIMVGVFAPHHIDPIKGKWILKAASTLGEAGALSLLIGNALLGPTGTVLLYKRSQRGKKPVITPQPPPQQAAELVAKKEEAPEDLVDDIRKGYIFSQQKSFGRGAEALPEFPGNLTYLAREDDEYFIYRNFFGEAFIVHSTGWIALDKDCYDYDADQVDLRAVKLHMAKKGLFTVTKPLSVETIESRRIFAERFPANDLRKEEVIVDDGRPIAIDALRGPVENFELPKEEAQFEPILTIREPGGRNAFSQTMDEAREKLNKIAGQNEYFVYANHLGDHFLVTGNQHIRKLPQELFQYGKKGVVNVNVNGLDEYCKGSDLRRLPLHEVKKKLGLD